MEKQLEKKVKRHNHPPQRKKRKNATFANTVEDPGNIHRLNTIFFY